MKWTNLFYNLVVAFLIGIVAQSSLGANPVVVAGGVLGAGQVIQYVNLEPLKHLTMNMALQKEIWQNTIEEEIFKDNGFMKFARPAEDEQILGGKVVHIPQSGGSGAIHKNPKSFPLTVRQRQDSDIVYVIDWFVGTPTHIPDIDGAELSYDKRVSVLGEDLGKMTQEIGDEMIYNWLASPAVAQYSAAVLPDSAKFAVTGANGTNNADAVGATGNRKMYHRNDLQYMKAYFVSIGKWKEGKMYCLPTPRAMIEMFPAGDIVTATYRQTLTEQERREGVIFKAEGWKFVDERSTVAALVNGTDALRAPGEAGAATDNSASLFWNYDSVEYAQGTIKFYEDRNNPLYAGDIFNYSARMGGRARRSDYKGIALLHQIPTS